jgi:hypothetical protein
MRQCYTTMEISSLISHRLMQFPYIPLAHAVHTKETCGILQVWLQKVLYEEHRWSICDDLTVTAMQTVL